MNVSHGSSPSAPCRFTHSWVFPSAVGCDCRQSRILGQQPRPGRPGIVWVGMPRSKQPIWKADRAADGQMHTVWSTPQASVMIGEQEAER